VDACTNLGTAYSNDATADGVPVDAVKSADLYWKACDAGFPLACRALALAYEAGNAPAVPKDPALSVELVDWGCNTGDGASCNDLGALYENGTGVSTDVAKAYALYRKACGLAAAGSFAIGCRNAERMFDAGLGLPPADAKKRADQIATNRKMEAAHPESRQLFPQRSSNGEPTSKDCRMVGFDLIQKLREPHMYEGAVGNAACGSLGCANPAANFLLRTKLHEFHHLGQQSICVRPEETWTTVRTVSGMTQARVVLEESLCACPSP
jgi:hypothetical protein